MSTIEIFAVIFASLTLLKLIVISINRKAWTNFWSPIFSHGALMSAIFLVLLAYTGWKVLEVVSIVEVGAIFLPLMFLVGLSMFPYPKIMEHWREEASRYGIGKAWFPMVVWAALSGWILYEVFWVAA